MQRPLIAKIEYSHDCICSDIPERYPDTGIRFLAELGEDRKFVSHLFAISGNECRSFIDSIRKHSTTAGIRVLRKTGDSADIITTTKREASTTIALKQSGCAFLSSPVYDGGIERIKVFAPSFGSLRHFIDALKNSHNVKVISRHFLKGSEKIRPQNLAESGFLDMASAADLLTKRQCQAFSLACAWGYYEMPKKASITDIAEKLEISSAATSELIRKAEKKLLPALAKFAELRN